ncbi:transcription elongation factor GreA [Methylobacterium nodulans]|uniref:GreA/GreB family elongation factor n=1 Tax=Methylobacterium nodulans (strain LMG 21967 / CNCM I-2342 / ORS 2060) TaxID=460265 RepID=B8IGS1_METNO|nr:transcription elongation factor GreA [Methylobacterium nodulans]ACL57796.1 GreA/GreB family elongation factor [Methylobacterium nodulans ORS 2060]
MSIAFVREPEGGEAFEDLPDRPISPHPNFVTPQGLALIEAELERLHAEHAALSPDDKANLSRTSRDLRYWTARRNSAQVIEPTPGDTVHFGSTVTVEREDGTRLTYHIVGEDEADPAKGSIAYVAPLARALTGKQAGDVVTVADHEVEIIEVR